jgi:NitT/TauT family transport system substrate-binding protein
VLRAYRNQAIDGMVISLDELFGLAVDGCSPRPSSSSTCRTGADVVGRGGQG